jgi:hypothetical protein
MRPHRVFAALAALAALSLLDAPARGDGEFVGVVPAPTPAPAVASRLYDADGTLGGFASSEAGLYFLTAPRWTLAGSSLGVPAVSLVAADTASPPSAYDLRILLAPDYEERRPLVRQVRARDAGALFVPLPITVTHAALFLPQALGTIEAELVPAGDTGPAFLYFRVRFTCPQLDVLRTLAHGGVALEGALTYDFTANDGPSSSTAPILVQLSDDQLTP